MAFRQGVECGFQGRTNKLVDGCYSFWQASSSTIFAFLSHMFCSLYNRCLVYVQGAAIALAQKMMTVVDEQSKPSYSSKLSSVDDACGTSSSGLASEKSSIGQYLCSIFSYGKSYCGANAISFINSYFCFKYLVK